MKTKKLIKADSMPADVGWLVSAAKKMLQPIARMLVTKINYRVAAQVLREAYIEEATRRAQETSGPNAPSLATLSLMTGIDTRLITAYQERKLPSEIPASDVCPLASILNAWTTDKKYLTKFGAPAALPQFGHRSMQALIGTQAGRNITPATVFRVLEASGNIRRTKKRVHLVNPVYEPLTDRQKKALDDAAESLGAAGDELAANVG